MNDIDPQYTHQSGCNKGKLNQSLLQVEGNFKHRDPHPFIKNLYFYNINKGTQNWYPKTKFNFKNLLNNQTNLQTNKPKGTFVLGDQHPRNPKFYYSRWMSKAKNKELWVSLESINQYKNKRDTYAQTYKYPKESVLKTRQYHLEYSNKPLVKFKKRLRGRIHSALLNQQATKHTPSSKLLGCPIEQAQNHIASLFQENMSWDNHGEWHIDHIIPCSSFDLTDPEEQKKCFHYTNLQPLWAHDNLSKGAKLNWQKAA